MTLDELRDKAVVSPDDLAPLLNCSTRSIYRMLDSGQLPEVRLGRRRLVPVPGLLRLLGADLEEAAHG